MTTEDLRELRSAVVSELRRDHRDLLDQISASSLKMIFNDVAPPELRIGGSAKLRVQLADPHPTSRTISKVTDAITAAVASIGHDIRSSAAGLPESARPISSADYTKTPVFVQSSGGNLIIIRPEAPDYLETLGTTTNSTSERALDRMANLLPESSEVSEASVVRDAVAAARSDRYALSRIASAAKAAGGLEVEWESSAGSAEGVLSLDHATELVKVLDEVNRVEEVLHVVGRLDGTRVKRRQFWLERDEGDIDGVVDEPVMPEVVAHLDQVVYATVIQTVATTKSGKASVPSYRLIGLSTEPTLS